jgi:hypothetical protein
MAKQVKGAGVRDPASEEKVSASPSLGLSDEQVSQVVHEGESPAASVPAAPAEVPRGQQGDEGRPYCPKHNCLMKATATRETVTHYACPVPACNEREKKVRPQLKVPAAPQACPQRICAAGPGQEQSYLQVDLRLSSLSQLHMACPRCGFHVNVPRPHFDAAAAQRARRQAEDLAAR